MSFLRAENLHKTYGTQQALCGVSLQVSRGEIFALLGESGSGKSTLLHLLAGLLDADEGQVFLGEKPILGPAHHLVPGYEDLKLVSQSFDLLPHHSVEENVRYMLRKYSADYQNYRLKTVLQLCQLERYAAKRPTQLSGGEQQRVALACALASEPAVLLLDEPFSHLDFIFRQRLKDILFNIARQTNTILFLVTHESMDALSVADTLGVLQKGTLVQQGAPQTLYYQPANAYVAQLLGELSPISTKEAQQLIGDFIPTKLPTGELFVRPEVLHFAQALPPYPAGQIEKMRFMGAFCRSEIRLRETGNVLIVYHPTQYSYTVGQVVRLRCSEKGICAY